MTVRRRTSLVALLLLLVGPALPAGPAATAAPARTGLSQADFAPGDAVVGRRKLGESAAEPRYLHSVRGVGVRLVDPGRADG